MFFSAIFSITNANNIVLLKDTHGNFIVNGERDECMMFLTQSLLKVHVLYQQIWLFASGDSHYVKLCCVGLHLDKIVFGSLHGHYFVYCGFDHCWGHRLSVGVCLYAWLCSARLVLMRCSTFVYFIVLGVSNIYFAGTFVTGS